MCFPRFWRIALESQLIRQIRVLQGCVVFLLLITALLCVNSFHPLLLTQHFRAIDAEQVNILERDGTLKAKLSDAAGFRHGERAGNGGSRFSGLMFYNEEGEETGGLVYQGKAIPGGQDSDVSLTMDQYRQDQNVYLNHTEHVDTKGRLISDGLQINSRPDWEKIGQEYGIYAQMDKLSSDQQEAFKRKALADGKISTRRLFIGVRRGDKKDVP
jgi:hypothetical protein